MRYAIVGVGNILFKDEGIGIYAAKFLESNYSFSEGVEVIDGGTLGFKLMRYYQDYDRVLIIDTVSIKDEPGAVYNLPSEALLGLGSYRQTAHEVEVVEMLEICSFLEKMAQVSVIGMVPEDIESVEISLSDSVKERFDLLINEILKELKQEGVEIEKKGSKKIDEIINEYANPSSLSREGFR